MIHPERTGEDDERPSELPLIRPFWILRRHEWDPASLEHERAAVEGVAAAGMIPMPLIIQYGNNPTFASRHRVLRKFMSMEEFEDHVARAALVIGHAGAGTIIHALASGHVPLVMPRRAVYGELVDDHQAELVRLLAATGRVVPAWEPEDLPAAVSTALAMPKPATLCGGNELIACVSKELSRMIEGAR